MPEMNNEHIDNHDEDEHQENDEGVRPGTWNPDKDKYPHGDREQPTGMWWNPEPSEQHVEHGIGDSR